MPDHSTHSPGLTKMMNIVHKKLYILMMGFQIMTNTEDAHGENVVAKSELVSEPSKKVCVGRFVIELPDGFGFSYGQAVISGVGITSNPTESRNDFNGRILSREKELMTTKGDLGISLERARDIRKNDAEGRIFHFGRVRSYHVEYGKKIDLEWFSIEAHIRVDDISYELSVEVGDDEQVRKVEQIIANLRKRKPDEIPGQEGFCFGNGIVLGANALPENTESTVLFAGDRRHPDVVFALSSMSGVTGDKTLLERTADSPTRNAYRSRFQTIFEGRRSINGMPGEEISEAVRELKGTRGHTFMWESDSVKDDILKPFISLELSTGRGRPGKPVNSSLSDKEVQALWGKISNSLRLRPVSPPVSEAAPVRQPPSSASAGTPCPRSGWWSCAEHADGFEVVGGTTQYLAEGVRVPEATLLGPRKMFGRRVQFERGTPTTWKFVKERT